jgi:hypothetical protein
MVCCSISHGNPHVRLRTLFLYTVSYWPNHLIHSIDTHYWYFQVGFGSDIINDTVNVQYFRDSGSEKGTGNISEHRELTALYCHNSLLHSTAGSLLDVHRFPCQFVGPECIHFLPYSVTKQVVGQRWNRLGIQ